MAVGIIKCCKSCDRRSDEVYNARTKPAYQCKEDGYYHYGTDSCDKFKPIDDESILRCYDCIIRGTY